MDYQKSWKSGHIRSWSGGQKSADMPGAAPNRMVVSKLSTLLAKEEPALVAFAEGLWDMLCSHPAGQEAADRHMAYLRAQGAASQARTAHLLVVLPILSTRLL